MAEVRQGVATEEEGVDNSKGHRERANYSMQEMHRRRTGVEVAAAAARMGVGDGVDAHPAKAKRAALLEGSMIARMALAGGEHKRLKSMRLCSIAAHGTEVSVQLSGASRRLTRTCGGRNEVEKRGGAGRGNWGAESEEIKECVPPFSSNPSLYVLYHLFSLEAALTCCLCMHREAEKVVASEDAKPAEEEVIAEEPPVETAAAPLGEEEKVRLPVGHV